MPTCRALAKGSTSKSRIRAWALDELTPRAAESDSVEQQLLDQFASLATTIQTRLDSSAGSNGSLGGSVEMQVQRALAQVLRSPGSGAVAVMTPGAATGLTGPLLKPAQNALLQEVRQLVDTALPLVGRLQPIVPNQRATSDVELYRAVLTLELESLIREISRQNGPRPSLVRVLLGGLLGWPKDPGSADLTQFRLLLLGVLQVPTVAQEEVGVAVEVLEYSAEHVLDAWAKYATSAPNAVLWAAPDDMITSEPVPPARASLAERLTRASEVAPGISRSAALVGNALDAIGFDFGERRRNEFELETLVDADVTGSKSTKRTVTVYDILDWATTLASDTPRVMSAAGQLGLNLLADQADELFWLIEAMYGGLRYETEDVSITRDRSLPSALTDAQVEREFVALARDLDQLAELACATPQPTVTPEHEGMRE